MVTLSHDAAVYCPDPTLSSVSTFQLDTAFDQHSTTNELYDAVVVPLVTSAVKGNNSVCCVVGEDEHSKSLFAEGRPASSLAGAHCTGLLPD